MSVIQNPMARARVALPSLPAAPPRLRVVCIGDELLSGLRVDRNSAELIARLSRRGLVVEEVRVVPDLPRTLEPLCREEGWMTLSTGGLGPTRDDRTRDVLAGAFGVELVHDEEHRQRFRARLLAAGRDPDHGHTGQSLHPSPGLNFANPVGSADGLFFYNERCSWLALPGVPGEMRAILDGGLEDWLADYLQAPPAGEALYARVWLLPEQEVARRVEAHPDLAAADLGYYPSPDGVLVKVLPGKEDPAVLSQALADQLGDDLLCRDERPVAQLVVEALKRRTQRISLAESCTGGLLAAAITDWPGSSAVFHGSWVVYDNDEKCRRLGVSAATLDAYGAVSAEVVREMAEGCRRESGADWCLSVSGIAGPDGGSEEKPLGTAFIGLASPQGVEALACRFHGTRQQIRQRAVGRALAWLYRQMSQAPETLSPIAE